MVVTDWVLSPEDVRSNAEEVCSQTRANWLGREVLLQCSNKDSIVSRMAPKVVLLDLVLTRKTIYGSSVEAFYHGFTHSSLLASSGGAGQSFD